MQPETSQKIGQPCCRAEVSNSILSRAASGVCFPLEGQGGRGLLMVADWVGLAGPRGSRGWSVTVSGMATQANSTVYHRPDPACRMRV